MEHLTTLLLTTLLFFGLIGMLTTEQRRVRPQAFAKELNISIRKLRELFTLGAPVTKIQDEALPASKDVEPRNARTPTLV
jgi:hypothetical protein